MTMRNTILLFAIFANLLGPFFVTADIVQDVTQLSLTSLLKESQLVLVAFTTQNLETLDAFNEAFHTAAEGSSTPFVIIDCDKEADLCEEQSIQAYPTIRLLRMRDEDLVVTRYRGRRTIDAIRSFVKKHEMPVLTHINTKDLADFKGSDTMVVIAYLDLNHHSLLETFRRVAERHYGDYIFGFSNDALITNTESITMPSIVCYNNNDGDHRALSGRFSEKDVEDFLEEASTSVIREFREREVEDFMVVSALRFHPDSRAFGI